MDKSCGADEEIGYRGCFKYFERTLNCVESAHGGFEDPGEETRLCMKRTTGSVYAGRGLY